MNPTLNSYIVNPLWFSCLQYGDIVMWCASHTILLYTLGRLLLAIRQGEELSQTEFGEQLGISRQSISLLRIYSSPQIVDAEINSA